MSADIKARLFGGNSTLRRVVQRELRRRGVEVSGYRWSVMARRQKLLTHLGCDMLIDVGGNIGQAAMSYRQGGYSGRILSLEPDSRAFGRLQAAAKDDPLWEVQHVAVSEAVGKLTLKLSEESQFNSVLDVTDLTVANSSYARQVGTETVDSTRLDDLLDRHVAADAHLALKIDVQGYERQVLNGAPRTLQRARYVDIEMDTEPIYAAQIFIREVVDWLDDAGFSMCVVENGYGDLRTGQCLAVNGIFARMRETRQIGEGQ